MAEANQILEEQRRAVAATCHDLARSGLLIGTAGNVSMRAGGHVAVSATGVVLGRATPEQVIVVGPDGGVVAGDLAPTSELELHFGIYQRFGAGAVVHTHSPRATALSLVLDELPCVHYQQLLLGGSVRVAPFAVFGSSELAESVLSALEGKTAALMANHGAITYGGTLAEAVERALLLEWACDLYLTASTIGTPKVLNEDQQVAVITAALQRGYRTTHPTEKESTR